MYLSRIGIVEMHRFVSHTHMNIGFSLGHIGTVGMRQVRIMNVFIHFILLSFVLNILEEKDNETHIRRGEKYFHVKLNLLQINK